MENAIFFRQKIKEGRVLIGANVSFTDPIISDILSSCSDFLWIDGEHAPMDLATIEKHMLATKGTECTPLVRIPMNDFSVLKVVLDSGAAGIIAPQVRSAEDVRAIVSACRYPPSGERGFGPRRASQYGAYPAADFCEKANQTLLVFAQVEHPDAVKDLDNILAISGLDGVVIGPFDLANSMGHTADPLHPEVQETIGAIVSRTREAGLMTGVGLPADAEMAKLYISKGIQWIQLGCDYEYLQVTARSLKEALAGEKQRL